ncbi:MAG: hypothetical protein ACRD3F_15745 [Acidobacteriaceae bacterium]
MTSTNHSPIKARRRGVIALVCAAVVIPFLASTPKANAQVSFNVQIGTPPVCPYGYYDYPPYPCAAPGFYGPGYFYNGIFLGIGPWANWGYAHGWGYHRFVGPEGGRYYRGYWDHHQHPRFDHRWDHGRPYGYYARRDHDRYDRGHYDRGHGHYDNRGHGHYDNRGHGGGDYHGGHEDHGGHDHRH